MTTHDHLALAGCPDCDCVTHAQALDALDPNVRATLLALLKQFGAKALPLILAELPNIIAGNWPKVIEDLLAVLVPKPA